MVNNDYYNWNIYANSGDCFQNYAHDIIENNTNQSPTSTYTFNRNAGVFTLIANYVQINVFTLIVFFITKFLRKIVNISW